MPSGIKDVKYFWLFNLIIIIIVFGILAKTVLMDNKNSEYRFQLNEAAHYIINGFSLENDLSVIPEATFDNNIKADNSEHFFLQPGEYPYLEFTIAAKFDYTAQYNKLKANPNVIPGIMLPGLGDNYEIYLNGNLIISEWYVENGKILTHKMARGSVYTINPDFFISGENTLLFRIYGDPTSFDTGITVTNKYAIDDSSLLNEYDYTQAVFAGIYISVAITFIFFFLLYREKKLNLWFSLTAFSISFYALFRFGAFQSIIINYHQSIRLEVISLFMFVYFATILIYSCNNQKYNVVMKIYTILHIIFCIAVFLPGHQFVLDLIKTYIVMFIPFVLYAAIFSLCIPLIKEASIEKHERESMLRYIIRALSGTLRGNMLIGAFLPIVLALFDQIAYIAFSYQEVILSQYSFIFFFINVTFALASDNAKLHEKLSLLSNELRTLISERDTQLAQKSGEVEEVKAVQSKLHEVMVRDICVPLNELIGSIELRLLRSDLTPDSLNWLNRILEAQRSLRKKLFSFFGDETEQSNKPNSKLSFENVNSRFNNTATHSNPGGTRHLFVINPKSFVTLKDLKNFLLSIEMCFSAGHRAEYKVYISRYPRDAYSAVYRYLSATPPDETARVYSVGGDGILFDCLNALAKFSNAELAPVPYGNANDFVRAFGSENMELFRNIKLMSKAPPRLVDVILCGQQYALCNCSIGIEAKAVQTFSRFIELINNGKARRFVPLLYNLGAIKSLFDSSQNNIKYRINLNGEDFSGDYLFVSIGNVALNGGSNIPNPLAVPDDGILDIILCKSASTMQSLKMLPAYTSGQFHKFTEYLHHYRFKEMHCESDKLMSVILDGETFYTRSLDLKILPQAVKIVSPNGIGFADYSKLTKGDI